ncbi:MAG: diadenylate cyclase CdaA [Treponema sp.]|jgi:diadenylate cyclase|nr:diadenylate cyclase CdaA [Treponema sp.]
MEIFHRLYSIYEFIRPVLDVALLAFILYKGYELLEKTHALPLIKGAGFLVLVYGIAFLLNLTTIQWVLTTIAPGLFIAIAIVFQPELRKIFLQLGQSDFFRPNTTAQIGRLDAVVTAAELLSQLRRGMLIVFPRKNNLKNIIETGTKINADISSSLIVAIFQFDGPLHDKAVVIQNGRIAAASCLLPLSERQDIRKNFGTRHRAGMGMAEQSDAVILIVSEESGAISLAYDSKLYYDLSLAEISRKLLELLGPQPRTGDPENTEDSAQAEENKKESSVKTADQKDSAVKDREVPVE